MIAASDEIVFVAANSVFASRADAVVDAFWELVDADACVAFVSKTCNGAVPKIIIYTCQDESSYRRWYKDKD